MRIYYYVIEGTSITNKITMTATSKKEALRKATKLLLKSGRCISTYPPCDNVKIYKEYV